MLLVVPGFGQVTGRLSGSVTDASGAAVPNATVNLLLPGGAKPVLTAVTTAEGLFSFTNVRPEQYDLAIESSGFLKYTLRGVKIDPARETSLPPIKLDLPTATQSGELPANRQPVQSQNPRARPTVTNEQVPRLPILDQNPMALM